MKKARFTLRCLVVVAAISGPAAADSAVVEDLYTARVERRSDVSDQRSAAMTDAMSQVLVRVTGSQAAAFAPELSELLTNPSRFVASFGYASASEAVVSFLPADVERALIAAGWPVWGAERPLSMLWVAVTDQFGEQALLEAGAPNEEAGYSEHMLELIATVREEIEAVAEARGLPIVFPDLATQEELAQGFALAWAYSLDGLANASAAAGANAVVIGRVRESVIGTDVEWLVQGDSLRLSYPGAGIRDGIEWLADAFAEQYRSIGGRRPLVMRISGVEDFDAYARVLAYLESVSILSDVDVESLQGDVLVVRAVSRGDASVLARTLTLGSVLREPDAFELRGTSPNSTSGTLELRVVPEFSGAYESGRIR